MRDERRRSERNEEEHREEKRNEEEQSGTDPSKKNNKNKTGTKRAHMQIKKQIWGETMKQDWNKNEPQDRPQQKT